MDILFGKAWVKCILIINFISESKQIDNSVIILTAVCYESCDKFTTDLVDNCWICVHMCEYSTLQRSGMSLMSQHCTKEGQFVWHKRNPGNTVNVQIAHAMKMHEEPIWLRKFIKIGKSVCKQNRSTEIYSKLKSPETRQVQERLVSTWEHLQVPKLDRTRRLEEKESFGGMPHLLQMFYGNI